MAKLISSIYRFYGQSFSFWALGTTLKKVIEDKEPSLEVLTLSFIISKNFFYPFLHPNHSPYFPEYFIGNLNDNLGFPVKD